MNSLIKHPGLSGMGVDTDGRIVSKWTKNNRKMLSILKKSYIKQVLEIEQNHLNPLKTVPIISHRESDTSFYFEMPYFDYDNGLTSKHHQILSNKIRESIKKRSNNLHRGFRELSHSELDRLESEFTDNDKLDLKNTVKDLRKSISLCSDFYLKGYAHGDFGPSNMLVSKEGEIYMIDFLDSYLYSPLIDVATFSLSLIGTKVPDHILKINKVLLTDFAKSIDQINVIKRLRIISWISNSRGEPRLKLLNLTNE